MIERGEDRLVLDSFVFRALQPGALAPGAFALGTEAQDADDRILYDSSTGNLYFDPDGTGPATPPTSPVSQVLVAGVSKD